MRRGKETMMKRRLFLIAFVVGSFVFTEMADAQTHNWRLSTIVPQNSFLGEGFAKFAEKVEKKTNGQMKVRVGFNSVYGGWSDSMKAVNMGSLEMVAEDVGRWEIANKNFRIASCFYAFSGWDHYLKWINSPLFQEEVKKLESSNYHVLIPNKKAVWKEGPYRVILSKMPNPIFKVSDYNNLKYVRLRLH